MAQTNYTPISLYYSTTASAVPVNTNLVNGELAINITDGKLFYKDNGGTVQVLATKGAGTIGGSNTQVQYNNSGALAGSANLTFNGTTLTANTLNLTNALGTTYGGTGLTSFTANGVVYASSSSALTTGSALTFTGSVLGVNNAGDSDFKLTTTNTGSGSTDGLLLRINSTGSEAYLWNWEPSSVLIFGANAAEQMRLTSTGLGIGTSSTTNIQGDASKLITSSGSASNTLSVVAGGYVNPQYAQIFLSGGYGDNGFVSGFYLRSQATVPFGAASENSFQIYSTVRGASPTLLATLSSAGNLGIGTSSPATKLDVTGGLDPTYNSNVLINSTASTGKLAFNPFGGFSSGIVGLNNGGIGFNAAGANTERMRLDSSGNLLVGTSAVGGKLYVVSDLTSNNGCRIDTPASFTATAILSISAVAGSTSWNHIAGNGNGGSQTNFIIYGNGNMVNANNSYGAVSDVKLKENIVDASPKLEGLMQVKVRNYNLIGETTKQIGVVAQELETVFPSMIDETVDKDAEGNELGTTTKQVKYSVFVPMLIKAIQEQQSLITTLTARISALESA